MFFSEAFSLNLNAAVRLSPKRPLNHGPSPCAESCKNSASSLAKTTEVEPKSAEKTLYSTAMMLSVCGSGCGPPPSAGFPALCHASRAAA